MAAVNSTRMVRRRALLAALRAERYPHLDNDVTAIRDGVAAHRRRQLAAARLPVRAR